MSVHRFLVTGLEPTGIRLGVVTGLYAHWIEARDNQHGTLTWLVTVLDSHGERFLEAARRVGATVEEIEGADDTERYLLRVGEPGTGWAEP